MSNESCVYNDKFEYYFFPALYGIIFIVGLVGNITAIGILIKNIKCKNVLSVYLLNLWISDIIYIFTLPVWIIYTAKESWQFGASSCKIVGFFINTNIYTTITFLCCIAMDRFMAIVYPFYAKVLRTMKSAVIICIAIWLILLGSHTIFLVENELFNDTYNIQLCYERYPMEKWVAQMNYFRIFVVFMIPFFLLVFSYCSVIRAIRHSASLDDSQKEAMTRLMLLMILIFVISYVPYHAVLFVLSYLSDTKKSTCSTHNVLRPLYHVVFSLTSISSALDPILNLFVSENVKKELHKKFASLCHCFLSRRLQSEKHLNLR